jgi:hypothetical protein
MKKILLALSLLVVITSVQARSKINALEASIIKVERVIPSNNDVAGTVHIDFINNIISIEYTSAPICLHGQMCALSLALYRYEVKLTSAVLGSCGEAIYTGSIDERHLDGKSQEIIITDYDSSLICDFAVEAPTIVDIKETYYSLTAQKAITVKTVIFANRLEGTSLRN